MAMLYSSLEYHVYSRDGKVMKYLVEPVYSDLALGYCISGPEPTINTESCPADSFVWMILITCEWPKGWF